ncbi:MAG: sigma-70 family RNA polymerase sigma factor [Clostridia bacterium]|nr:sigma-70 family RNA polymerase sigma factor [Clostridia bacterium]
MTRDELILNNLGLVGSCASKFIGKGVDYDDLYSAGCVGLIKAADGFREDLGFAFSTYAVPSILGEIRRIFRDDGAVKISRSLKEKARELAKIKENFEKENGVEPTVNELSEIMNMTPFETAQIICVLQPVRSLTAENDEEGQIDIPTEDEYSPIEDKLSIHQVLKELPPDDRQLIILRFYKGLTQSKTANIMGISQVQVSRKEKNILQNMRKKLTG